jgi:hypothetical protein
MSKSRDDFELRYSLRSLNEQSWVGKVFIVGHWPQWIKNAHHISFGDQWNLDFKDKNIIKKMLRACTDDRVSDPFVANSDDQYWMRPIQPEDMLIPPRENPAQMDIDRVHRMGNPNRLFRNRWVKRQFETVKFLREKGKCEICFDGHVPYLIHKKKYLRTMAEIPWEMGDGFLIVVYQGWNFNDDCNGFKIESRDGVLVRIKADLIPKVIEEKTKTALFLNHNNKALTIGMREFLTKRFPNPSRWE